MNTRFRLTFSKVMILLLCLVMTGCTGCSWFAGCTWFRGCNNSNTPNDIAERQKEEKRFIRVINGTVHIINTIIIEAGEGIEISKMSNPDDKSVSFEIDKVWNDYGDFHIILIDAYDLHYEKRISNIPVTGRTDVKITEDDYVEYPGDWFRKIERDINEKK